MTNKTIEDLRRFLAEEVMGYYVKKSFGGYFEDHVRKIEIKNGNPIKTHLNPLRFWKSIVVKMMN